MLNISFNELAIVGLLAILLFKPKDYPVIIEQVKNAISQVLDLKDELTQGKYSIEKEIQEIEQDLIRNDKIIPQEEIKDEQ